MPGRVAALPAAMRARLAIVGPAALLACALSPRVESPAPAPAAESRATVEAAPSPATAPEAPRPVASPGVELDASARALAEVSAMDSAARWAWAVAAMPELAEHREVGSPGERLAELRRLAGGRTALWVRIRGERCFAVRGSWEDDGFVGRAREVATIAGETRTVRFESVTITEHGISASGPHGDEFVRDARGRWQPAGGFGLGSGATLVDRSISEVVGGVAYYGGYDYTLTIECLSRHTQEERCTDGSLRRCERCTGLWARPHAAGMVWGGFGTSQASAGAGPVDCSAPCPADPHTPRIAALDLAMQGRRFLADEAPVAALYLDARTCRGDRRMR